VFSLYSGRPSTMRRSLRRALKVHLLTHAQDAPCQKTPCLSEQFVMDIELLVLGPELLYCEVSTGPS
jgi:hypothetical protein